MLDPLVPEIFVSIPRDWPFRAFIDLGLVENPKIVIAWLDLVTSDHISSVCITPIWIDTLSTTTT